jgi:predicted dinucleotide-utilizing enzyme
MKTQPFLSVIESLVEIKSQLDDSVDASVIVSLDDAINELTVLVDGNSEEATSELSSRALEILGIVLKKLPQIEALIRMLSD